MDNTEGTPHADGNSVETTREASGRWNNLKEDYERLGSMAKVGRLYKCRSTEVRAELARQGIPINPVGSKKGHTKSESWRINSSKHWNDPQWRDIQRQNWLERLPLMNGRAANSPLEKMLHKALLKAGISFSTQDKMCGKYLVDIKITQAPVIIEADGARHRRANYQERDRIRDAEITAEGYRVFRFTGTEINRDPDGCVCSVIEACGLVQDAEPVAIIRNGSVGENNNRWRGGVSRRTEKYICERCGCEFEAVIISRNNKHKFCSKKCQIDWLRFDPEMVKRRAEGKKRQRERTQQIRQMVI